MSTSKCVRTNRAVVVDSAFSRNKPVPCVHAFGYHSKFLLYRQTFRTSLREGNIYLRQCNLVDNWFPSRSDLAQFDFEMCRQYPCYMVS